jgi:PAS domain S-box-containing protein
MDPEAVEPNGTQEEADSRLLDFGQFFRKHDAVFLLVDGDTGRLLDANDAALRFYGYTLAQIRSMRIGDINQLPPDELDAERQRAVAGKGTFFIVPHRLASGKIRTVEVHTTPVVAGDETYLFSVIHDASERVRVEDALRASEERFRVIASSTPDHVALQDEELRYVFVINPQLGLTQEDMIGRTDYDFLSREEADRLTEVKTRVLETGEPAHFETSLMSEEGEGEFFDGTYVPDVDADGRIKGLIGYFRNVTERKQIEEALRDSGLFIASILDTTPNLVYIYDLIENRNVYSNREVSQFLGYTPEQIKAFGSTLFENILHPDDAALAARHHERCAEAGDGDVLEVEYRMKHSDGQWRWLRSRDVAFACDEQGRVTQILGFTEDITERRQAEQALRDSEEKFRNLFDNAEVGMFRTRLDGSEMLDLNDRYLEILGYDREELIGKPSVTVWADPREREAMAQTLEATGRVLDLEFDLLTKQGEVRRCLTSLKLYRDEGILEGSITDITERKQLEREFARVASFPERNPTPIVEVDADGGVFYMNPAARRLLPDLRERGFDHSWLSGLEAEFTRLREGDSDETARDVAWDGSAFQQNVHYIRDEDRIRIYAVDITERKQAEEALRREEELYRATFDQAAVGIANVSVDGSWTRVNQRLCDILGYTREELLGLTFADITHPDDVGDNVEHLNAIVAGEEDTYETEKRYFRKDGSVVWVDLNVGAIRREDGSLDHQVTVLEDITASKQAEESLRESEARLRVLAESLEARVTQRTHELEETIAQLTEANEAKTRFLRSMSHELRTPLNSVIGFSSVLADGIPGQVNEEQARQLAMIKSSGQHLLALINDILDVSRIEAGAVEVHPEPIDVAALLAEAVDECGPSARDKGLALTSEVSEPVPTLCSDPRAVRQILLNLISNAVKFTDAGEVVVRAFQPSAHVVCFSVSDTGRGIAAEERERVFREFEQAPGQAPNIEGTGLGLAICRGLAGSLGGTLKLESTLGESSTFTLTLPETREGIRE